MEKLFVLLSLQRQALEAPTRLSFAHSIVNQTLQLIPYQQAVFWSVKSGQISLEKASGNVILDDKGAYASDIKNHLRTFLDIENQVVIKHTHHEKQIAVVLFSTKQDGLLGGLWLENDKEYQDNEIQILQELAVSYSHALALLSLRKKYSFVTWIRDIVRHKKYLLIAVLVFLLLPVRQTITAPAEIVAQDADIITIPHDGMVDKVLVKPGDNVEKDQVVAVMESSALTAQLEIAKQELDIAQMSLARLQREALGDATKKADITLLESQIAEKKIRADYAQDMQQNSEIKSSRSGTAIFSDANKAEGKPMVMGAPLMTIADPQNAELLIRVPSEALIPIDKSASVEVYLNASPLFGRDAVIKTIGYQPSLDPDGMLTYKLRANLLDKEDVRIGWQGTAKIKGGWTVLSYSVLRRPIVAFRHLTGI